MSNTQKIVLDVLMWVLLLIVFVGCGWGIVDSMSKNLGSQTYLETPTEVRAYLKDCGDKHGTFSSKRLDDEIGGWMVTC